MKNQDNKREPQNAIEKDVTVRVDFGDWRSIIDAMDNYSHIDHMIFGKNSEGERIAMSIWSDKIILNTFQSNGWTRINIYYRDGDTEETYDR